MHAADLLSARTRLTPERLALVEVATGQSYTYRQLNERANRLANLMRKRFDLQKGERVAILAHNCVAYVDLLYGLGKIGGVLAPVNWRLSGRELSYILSDSQPKILIVGPEFIALASVLSAAFPQLQLIGVENAPLGLSYEMLLAEASPEEPQRPPLSGEDPYCILYTSGTTGKPKGAVLPHRQVLWNAINTVVSWGLSENDVSPIFTPMFHAGGLFIFLTPLFYVGGKIILARSFDPMQSLHLIIEQGCTAVLGVPTLYQVWLNTPEVSRLCESKVRFFISGGAPCPPALIEAWHTATGRVLRQGYGLTEAGVNCFSMTDEEATSKAGSVGKPIFHAQMRLVDNQDRDVPVGEAGELLISGPLVCSGYWQNPAASAQALRDGWLHTGDMARQDVDGFFYIAGRYKDMLISGGENIYAAEVETVFREHPAVADAALIGQPDEKWGEVGLIIVALKPGQNANAEELLTFCQGRLARYKIPRRVEFLVSLPYSPYGKVVKAELRKQFLEEV